MARPAFPVPGEEPDPRVGSDPDIAPRTSAPVTVGVSSGSMVYAGRQRQWRLFVPSVARSRQVPLVVLLHQAGANPATFGTDTSMDTFAEVDGFMTVSPLGLGPSPTWNAGACCGWARDTGIDDVGFIGALLSRLIATEPVDATQVYAAGASNGGMLAYALACRLADRFQAVFSAAGTQTLDDCEPDRPVSIVEFHSLTDPLVPYQGGVQPRYRSVLTDFASVGSVFAAWAVRDRCRRRTSQAVGGGEVLLAWWGCRDATLLEVWLRTIGGGHEWPRAPEAPVDASAVVARAVSSGSLLRRPGAGPVTCPSAACDPMPPVDAAGP